MKPPITNKSLPEVKDRITRWKARLRAGVTERTRKI